MSTKIEWTEKTWSPVTGCDKISDECRSCYALTLAGRLKLMGQPKYQNDGDPRTSGPGFAVTCHPDELDRPLKWRKPQTIFVCSMADLFHKDVTNGFIGSTWNTMALTPRHTYQILTKRSERMRQLMSVWYAAGSFRDHRMRWVNPPELPLPNVWLGVSCGMDRYAFRLDHLRATPAAVRFVSFEPLIERVPSVDLTGIDWCIIGSESGKDARPMELDWAREIVAKAREAGTAVFVKQLSGGFHAVKDIDQFPEDLRIREYPVVAA